MGNYEKYRTNLAEDIKDAPREERRKIPQEARGTEEYEEAREEKRVSTASNKQSEKTHQRIQELMTELQAEDEPVIKEPEILDPGKAKTWKAIEQKTEMPHIAGISQRVETWYKNEGKKDYDPEIVKDILYCFLEKGINNTKIFTSLKHEASFPYTTVDTAEIAKALYRAYSGHEIGALKPSGNEENPMKKRMEFLFGSFQLVSHGNQFTFTEEVLHQIFKDLPAAIEKIEKGEEPDSNEVCVVGSPTTLTGTMSKKFLDEIKDHAFESYGDMYAELVKSRLPQDTLEKENTSVMLYGISMGASFAGQTAKRILEDGDVTQSRENEKLPFMQVRIDTAPGHRNQPGLWSKAKLFGGFAASTIYTMATDSYTRDVIFKNGKFMGQVNGILTEKGLAESHVDPEQLALKKKAISGVEHSLAKGVSWPEGVKATEVVGLQDALTYDAQLNKDAYKQRADNINSLGTHSVPEQSGDDIRVRSAKMSHAIPFTQRANEVRRMGEAVVTLEKLRKSAH